LLSLNAPGVQAEPDPVRAVASARQVNDTLAEVVAASPSRYGGMAALPMQDPAAAAAELERCATSGLFDRFPRLTVIIGHLGETLPFNIWRINHRASFMGDLIKFQKPLTHSLLHNFYVTTSGNFHTQTLDATLAEMGADRALFSTDYPYESMREAADWFDNAAINDNDRVKIGYANARSLFLGLPERIGRPAEAARV
jgi:predicted TIM-barrel fold metal-dependent hydrolase